MSDHPLPMPPVASYELATDGRSSTAVLARREQRGGEALWGIFDGGSFCLTAPGVWEWEPSPSNHDEDYLSRARRDLAGALELWRDHLLACCAGATWRDAVVGSTAARDCLRVHDPEGIVSRLGDPVDRPRPGSWVGADAVEAYGRDEGRDGDTAREIDGAFRAGLAVLAGRWLREGRAQAVVARDCVLEPDVFQALPDWLRDRPGAVAALGRDLCDHLADGRAFRVGDALLLASGRAVVARVGAAAGVGRAEARRDA